MPELTEITNETPIKIEETEARIEDDDDDDSDTTIPELEDTGNYLRCLQIQKAHAASLKQYVLISLVFFVVFPYRQHRRSFRQRNRRSSRFGVESKTISRRKKSP